MSSSKLCRRKKHLNNGELQEIVCKSGFKKFWHQCPLYLSQAPFHKAANANTTDATFICRKVFIHSILLRLIGKKAVVVCQGTITEIDQQSQIGRAPAKACKFSTGKNPKQIEVMEFLLSEWGSQNPGCGGASKFTKWKVKWSLSRYRSAACDSSCSLYTDEKRCV